MSERSSRIFHYHRQGDVWLPPPLVLLLRESRSSEDTDSPGRLVAFSVFIVSGVPDLQDILHHSLQTALSRSAPTSASAVAKLPSFEVAPNSDYSDPCSVCQENFQEKETLVRLPCQHLYHKDCVTPWLSTNNTCPVCRYELPVDDPERESARKERMAERDEEISKKLSTSCQLSHFPICAQHSQQELCPLQPCGHVLHQGCLSHWVAKHEDENTELYCPTCLSPSEVPAKQLPFLNSTDKLAKQQDAQNPISSRLRSRKRARDTSCSSQSEDLDSTRPSKRRKISVEDQ